MQVISDGAIPVKMWIDNIEESALEQIRNISNLPFAYKHIAIMPDCHTGYGMPIGGVLATNGIVIPNAVGVDIGCGMCAVKTSCKDMDIATLKIIMGKIRESIPLGFDHHKEKQDEKLMPLLEVGCESSYKIINKEYNSALKQLGTLGGGNHFVEIQKDTEGFAWIMIHSGSRNLGKQVCDYYNNIATEINEKYYSSIPTKWELSFLPHDTQEAFDYLLEMKYCMDFAMANRFLMIDRIKAIFYEAIDCTFDETINIHHNFAQWENHFGKNVIVHRKGATLARKGQIGIIPGSQGTKSYITRGKGNLESFNSCSHGAGRKMGRKQAERELNLKDEVNKLNEQGILHGIRGIRDLDEAPGAYKNIEDVMAQQSDLVDIVTELTPMGVIKA